MFTLWTTTRGMTMKKLLGSAAILIAGAFLTLLPIEFWILIWKVMNPVGFWQKAVITGVGLWWCFALQIVFFIMGGSFTFFILTTFLDDLDMKARRKLK